MYKMLLLNKLKMKLFSLVASLMPADRAFREGRIKEKSSGVFEKAPAIYTWGVLKH